MRVRPNAAPSPPSSRRQKPSVITATRGPPATSSSAAGARPMTGVACRVEKKLALTRAIRTCTGGPWPVSVCRSGRMPAVDWNVLLSAARSRKSGPENDQRALDSGGPLVDADELLRRTEPQRPEHHPAQHAEHGRAAPDPDCEHQHARGGKAGDAQERSKRDSQLVHDPARSETGASHHAGNPD